MPAEKPSAWAIAGLILGILGICSIPIPFVPSFCVGGLGIFAGALALRSWQIDSWKRACWRFPAFCWGSSPG